MSDVSDFFVTLIVSYLNELLSLYIILKLKNIYCSIPKLNATFWCDLNFTKISAAAVHRSGISCMDWQQGLLATGSWDGSVCLWQCSAANGHTPSVRKH